MIRLFALATVLTALTLSPAQAQSDDPDAWSESLDAVTAAPDSHEVLYEDENVRLLSVTIDPGEAEPMHHHRSPSVIMVDSTAHSIYSLPDGTSRETQRPGDDAPVPRVITFGPEPLHSVENIDSIPFHLYRLEFKNLEFRNQPGAAE